MLYDFVIWAGRRCTMSSRHRRHASSVRVAWPIPIGRPSRRAGAPGCPPASRYDLTRRLSYRGRTRARGLVRPSSRVAPERAGVRGGCLARDETRTSAGSWRLLVYPGHALPRRARSRRHDHGAGTARTPYGRPARRDGGALPSLSIYLYTLSRSRRSNMQPARDHLNSITVVCASPRRAAPLRLHRPHVARVYRTTGDHRTHYLIKSRSEPKRPPRG